MEVYFHCCYDWFDPSVFFEVTPEGRPQINVRMADGRSIIIREGTTTYYEC